MRYLLSVLCLFAVVGCSLTKSRTDWQPLAFTVPDADAIGNWRLIGAEDNYLAAVDLESKGCATCVEYYLNTAGQAWAALEHEFTTEGKSAQRTMSLYRSSVAKLIITGQRFGKWDRCRGLVVCTPKGTTVVPTSFQGFNWTPDQFQHLEPVGDYSTPEISHRFRNDGLGVPLVVTRNVVDPQPFTREKQTFTATAIVCCDDANGNYRLEFHDPLRLSSVQVANCSVPLARDLSADFAYASLGKDRVWLNNFLQPGATGSRDGLFMIEPYQPGKIPVIFVHGLLSDPATWAGVVNELRVHPNLNQRFQWWGFEYSTGEPFFTSAAVLRRQLKQIRDIYDPMRQDPTLSQTILVGHSLGGLVAKLQVTNSEDRLWQAAFQQPLNSVKTTVETRKLLQESFFFRPSPDISCVIYIGTPHAGSAWARRPIGRLGSALVEISPITRGRHQQLAHDNPMLFREELRERFPTSIDLLEPSSPLLAATASLSYSPAVRLHSIVGTGKPMRDGTPADGVVPVSSARLNCVASELMLDAKHDALHRVPGTVAEIARILQEQPTAVGEL